MPWSPNISSIEPVDEATLSPEYIISVKDIQATNSLYKTKAVIKNRNTTYLIYTTKLVIKYWRIFNLNYSAKAIVLNKRIIIKAGIKAKIEISASNTYINIRTMIWHKKIKLPILKNRKLNTVFHKDKRLTLIKVPIQVAIDKF
jgi:hypothetical protein